MGLGLFLVLFNGAHAGGENPYKDAKTLWRLTELNGQAFSARATLSFPKPDQITGRAPCNRFFGPLNADYPEFEASRLASTKMACPDLTHEAHFLGALSRMERAERTADHLILTNGKGEEMRFSPMEINPAKSPAKTGLKTAPLPRE